MLPAAQWENSILTRAVESKSEAMFEKVLQCLIHVSAPGEVNFSNDAQQRHTLVWILILRRQLLA